MGYQKINMELIVFSEEADAVVADLNSAIDVIEASHAIFGGEIATASVEAGTRTKSALRHALNARTVAMTAVQRARRVVVDSCKQVV